MVPFERVSCRSFPDLLTNNPKMRVGAQRKQSAVQVDFKAFFFGFKCLRGFIRPAPVSGQWISSWWSQSLKGGPGVTRAACLFV